jgi:hypothetical protein
MPAPNITILWNSSQNDTPNTGGASGDSNFKVLDQLNDRIAFLGEGTSDQDPNSSKSVFTVPESAAQEIPRQFVNDYDQGVWDRVWLSGSDADNGGGGNYRYPYGAYIDGTTASVPILQCWDSTAHSTYNLEVLGSGTPGNSMLRAVATTNGSPGASWAGTPLAGDGESNTVELDAGPIGSSKMVYWNMRLLVPVDSGPFTANPVLSIYVTYS